MHSRICRSSITRLLVSLSGIVYGDSASASVQYSVQRLGQRLCPVQCTETRSAPMSDTVYRDSASATVRYSVHGLGQRLCPVQCVQRLAGQHFCPVVYMTRPAPLSGTVCTGTRSPPLSGTVCGDSASTSLSDTHRLLFVYVTREL